MNNQMICKFFESWSGYSIPFHLIREIDKNHALSLKVYYVGCYQKNQLISIEKIIDSQREWIDLYEYFENSKKIKKRTMTKASGEIIVQEFDKKGKLSREYVER